MRRAVAASIGALALVAGPVAPAGAGADVEAHPEWGSVSTESGVLKKGCRNYRFSYAVTPPEDGYWDLNVNVVGPSGRTLFVGYVSESEGDPRSGTASYRLCRSETRPGRYKLKTVVTVMESNEYVQGRLPTIKFRLDNRR